MTPFKVSCEHCDASFKISDASKIGKRVKCPKCSEPFTIRDPNEDEDEFEDEYEEPVAKPARPSAKKTPSRGKKSSKKGETPVGLYAGGGAAVVAFVVAVLWFAGMFGGSKAGEPQAVAPPKAAPQGDATSFAAVLGRLPADTEILMHLRVKDALASPLATGLRTPQFDAQLTAPNPMFPGVTLSGINHITVALSNVTRDATDQKLKDAAPVRAPGALPFPMEPIVVVALNDPLTPEALKLPAEGAIKHMSSTIYRNPGAAAPGAPACLCLFDPKLLFMGSDTQLKSLIDQTSASSLGADFPFIDGQSHVALAMCPRNLDQQLAQLASGGKEVPGLHKQLSDLTTKGTRTIGLTLSLTSDLDGGVTLLATDAAQLGGLQALVEGQVKSMQDAMANPATAKNPMLAQLKPVVESIKVSTTADRVSASTTLPKDALATLGQSFAAMAAPMMMQMAAPPPAAPPRSTP